MSAGVHTSGAALRRATRTGSCDGTRLHCLAARAGTLATADTAPYVVAVATLAGAMGLQGVNLRQVRDQTVRTTFVTGMLINLVETFVAAWHAGHRDERRSATEVKPSVPHRPHRGVRS